MEEYLRNVIRSPVLQSVPNKKYKAVAIKRPQ